jgi:hypothetical protein
MSESSPVSCLSSLVSCLKSRAHFGRSVLGIARNGGAHWSAKIDVSSAAQGVSHAFPAIVAGKAGDVRIAWLDARAPGTNGSLWNTYYRNSTNGGATWSAESDISTFVAGYDYIQPDGFNFPFGDYFEMDIDDRGTTHAIWGEGRNYDTPGSIWYARGT